VKLNPLNRKLRVAQTHHQSTRPSGRYLTLTERCWIGNERVVPPDSQRRRQTQVDAASIVLDYAGFAVHWLTANHSAAKGLGN
jgi:hypothetical protein